MSLHPVLRFIYLLLRVVSWLGLSVFYRRRVVLGRENLDFEGPAIIVVNHPSTLMDVLNSCVHIPRESFFLANYGLFKHPVSRWLLTRLYCIPVKRREDVAEGEVRNNDAAFEQSFRHLERKGMLFIAAEGVSYMERRVRPFKTGAARIAFGAEARNNWQLGVKILPIGLSYSAPNLFRSEVIVHYGAPLDAAAWAHAESENHEQAVDDLTNALENGVRSLVLDTRDPERQVFIERLETVFKADFPGGSTAYFAYRKSLIERNIDNEALRNKLSGYFEALAEAGLTDTGIRDLDKGGDFASALLLLAGLPFFLPAYIFWWLPCYLPWLAAKKMNLYIGYDSNVKLLLGLFTFPLALWGVFRVAAHWLGSAWYGLAAAAGFILLGYFAEIYLEQAKALREKRAAAAFAKKQPSVLASLLQKRREIVESTQ